MAFGSQSQKMQRLMVQQVNLERQILADLRFQCSCEQVEGCAMSFAEYLNLVLDDAGEIPSKTKSRKQLGWIMIKRNITLLQIVSN